MDFDKHLLIEQNLMRNLELYVIYGDNSKSKEELGWNYDLSLDQLINKLINDEKKLLEWTSKN